jgi:hypothetical protein
VALASEVADARAALDTATAREDALVGRLTAAEAHYVDTCAELAAAEARYVDMCAELAAAEARAASLVADMEV